MRWDPYALPKNCHRRNVSGNYQQSNPEVVSPFGGIPTAAAGQYLSGFAAPFARGLDKGRMKNLGGQVGTLLSSLIPKFQALGTETAGIARTAYGGYQASVDQFLKQLPGYQGALDTAYKGPTGAAAGDVMGQQLATQAATEAFSPTASSALYNQFANTALSRARTSEAARGIADTGAAGAAERQDILTPLAQQFAAARPAAEQAAVQGLDAATAARMANAGLYATTGAGLAGMAPTAQGNLFAAMPQLVQSLITSLGLPASAAGSIIQMLTGANQPLIQLADVTKPTVAQKSFGMGQSVGISDERVKEHVQEDVAGLEAVQQLVPVSFEYTREMHDQPTPFPPGRQIGFIAQQVQPIVPEIVQPMPGQDADPSPYLGVDYSRLVPVLVNAIKELAARVEQLEGK